MASGWQMAERVNGQLLNMRGEHTVVCREMLCGVWRVSSVVVASAKSLGRGIRLFV